MNRIRILLLAVALPFLSSCITIYEKYTINRDGSGTMEYLIDMGELKSFIQAIADSSDEMNSVPEFDQSFHEMLPGLNELPGISNIRLTGNPDNFVFGIRYDFRDQESLNRAMGVIFADTLNSGLQYVELKKKLFIRHPLISGGISDASKFALEDSSDNTLAMKMLDEMDYAVHVTFNGRRVKKVKSMAEVEKTTDSSVSINATFSQILNNNEYLSTEIKSK